jgi:hypothetical protein
MPGVIDFLEDGEGSSSAVDITASLLGDGRRAGKSQKADINAKAASALPSTNRTREQERRF